MTWVTRQVEHGFKLRKVACTISDDVEEQYLRTDLACGAPDCGHCHSKSQHLPSNATHYIIPTAQALEESLEIFSLPDFEGYILLSSVLKEVQRKANVRLNARIRQLSSDLWRSISVFDNLHCLFTAPTLQDRCNGNDVLKAAQYFADHLDNRVPVVVLTGSGPMLRPRPDIQLSGSQGYLSGAANHEAEPAGLHQPKFEVRNGVLEDINPDDRNQESSDDSAGDDDALDSLLGLSLDDKSTKQEKAVGKGPIKLVQESRADQEICKSEAGIAQERRIMTPAQYFAQHWKSHDRVQELALAFSDAPAGRDSSPSKKGKKLFRAHLSPTNAQAGIEAGTLVKGVLQVSIRKRGEAFVKMVGRNDIFLPDKQAINRALHGDTVAVRLVSTQALTRDSEVELIPDGDIEAVDSDNEEAPEADVFGESNQGSPQKDQTWASRLKDKGIALTGEVVCIMSAVARDIVVCIEEADESTVHESGRTESVLCVPLDKRMPKLRLRSTNLSKLLGQRFVVRLDSWDRSATYPSCHLLRVLGPVADLGSSMEAILAGQGIEEREFSQGALAELPHIADPSSWTIPAEELSSRRDLRGDEYFICSIDPPGCTDVDDCLSVRIIADGQLEFGVHIADVSHFVRQGSSLDAEGLARGTTVYLVDRRLDMLPSLLSEHLCSLRAGQDRLAVSVIWTVNADFQVESVWFGRTIIRSKYQLAYKQAQDILDGSNSASANQISAEHREILRTQLGHLKHMADLRRAGRMKDGALELESSELSFETSAEGQSVVQNKEVVPMMAVVAEMMIWANETVAEKLVRSFPTAALIRSHAAPPLDAFEEIAEICQQTGVKLDVSSPAGLAHALNAALSATKDASMTSLIKGIATRAMQEAQYTSTGGSRTAGDGTGHFGLALKHYTHFTSPIRRYADIVVHRQLLAALEASPQPPIRHAQLAAAADTMNLRTRQAKVAQRECSNLFFLNSIERTPQLEHALVYGLSSTTVQLFLPKFAMRTRIFLYDRDGRVKAPLDHATLKQDDPENTKPAQTELYDIDTDGGRLRFVRKDNKRTVIESAVMQKVWVLLTCKPSRNHGGQLQVNLVTDSRITPLAKVQLSPSKKPADTTKRQLIKEEAAKLRVEREAKLHIGTDQAFLLQHSSLLDQFQSRQSPSRRANRTIASVILDTLQSIATERETADESADQPNSANNSNPEISDIFRGCCEDGACLGSSPEECWMTSISARKTVASSSDDVAKLSHHLELCMRVSCLKALAKQRKNHKLREQSTEVVKKATSILLALPEVY